MKDEDGRAQNDAASPAPAETRSAGEETAVFPPAETQANNAAAISKADSEQAYSATASSSVLETMALLSRLESYDLSVHPERCTRVRNRHSSCRRCAEACTSDAIGAQGDTWTVRPGLCVGCGTCATVCPTCALETQHPNDAYLLSCARSIADKQHGSVAFACERAACRCGIGEEDAVTCTCLSRIEETLIATLFAEGIRNVELVCADCADCPRHDGEKSVRLVCETMDKLVRAWDIDAHVGMRQAKPIPGSESPMPDATSARPPKGASGSDACPKTKPTRVMEDGTLPHFVPERRLRLLDSLETFGEPSGEIIDTRLWGHVSIDMGRCQSCRMCAVFCPTGALSRYEGENGDRGIEHYVAECVHCCLCQDICPSQAIICSTGVPAQQLAQGETERYSMREPAWHTGPDQILRRMQTKIGGNSVSHSY